MLLPSQDEILDPVFRLAVMQQMNAMLGRKQRLVCRRSGESEVGAAARAVAQLTFPSPTPVSVTLDNLRGLQHVPHVIFPKTDGFHFIALLTRVDDVPVCVFTARNMRMFRVPVAAPMSAFRGSLFEGELAETGPDTVSFFLFRVLWIAGDDLRHQLFLRRHARLASLLSPAATPLDAAQEAAAAGRLRSMQPGLRFAMKVPRPVCDMLEVARDGCGPTVACDGLIFVPNVTHNNMLRRYPELKAKSCHTVDFVLSASSITVDDRRLLHVEIKYTLGTELQDAFTKLSFGGEHVMPELVRCEPFHKWLRARKGLALGETHSDLVEFRVRLRPLTHAEMREKNHMENDRITTMRHTFWNDGTRNDDDIRQAPRRFSKMLECRFQRVRPDKHFPNTLTTLVSTLAQSAALSMDVIYDEICAQTADLGSAPAEGGVGVGRARRQEAWGSVRGLINTAMGVAPLEKEEEEEDPKASEPPKKKKARRKARTARRQPRQAAKASLKRKRGEPTSAAAS